MHKAHLVQTANDIWVNVGGGNIEHLTYDPPIHGFEKRNRVRVQFSSGQSKLMPEGLPIEIVAARLNGFVITDQGSEWWCEGNMHEDYRMHEDCPIGVKVVHGSHGYIPGE